MQSCRRCSFAGTHKKKSPLRTESLSYIRINSIRLCHLKDLFLQQNVENRAVTLLLKKPAQRLIPIPKAHHNINSSNSLSKGLVMHLPSLLLEEDKVILWLMWKKEVVLNL